MTFKILRTSHTHARYKRIDRALCNTWWPTLHPLSPSHQRAGRPGKDGALGNCGSRTLATSSEVGEGILGPPPGRDADAPRPNPKIAPTWVHRGEEVDRSAWECGAVLVDKPQDWTSFDVVAKLRGAIKIKKVGHAGTLDPMATGLLVICTGRATKLIDSFTGMEKEYTGTLRLGESTPSFDACTEVTARAPWEHITGADLEAAKQAFLGDIQQLPPMYSAVKVKGKRLYEAARRGEEVERKLRSVSVMAFRLDWQPGHQNVDFQITCSKGTYIRSLAHDLGQSMGCCAHLVALRRTRIGDFSVSEAWSLPELVDAVNLSRTT